MMVTCTIREQGHILLQYMETRKIKLDMSEPVLTSGSPSQHNLTLHKLCILTSTDHVSHTFKAAWKSHLHNNPDGSQHIPHCSPM